MKRLIDIDLWLILLVFAVTVPRSATVIATYEAPGLQWVGWLAAVAFDLSVMRLAFVWQTSRRKLQRRWTLSGFVLFAVFSWAWQAMYLFERTDIVSAIILSAAWPALIIFLAVHRGMTDGPDRPDVDKVAAPSMTLTRTETRKLAVVHAERLTVGQKAALAIELSGQGQAVDGIAAHLGVSERTVRRYLALNQPPAA